MRIYLCGSHSTGKTELARRIAKVYNLPLVCEVARQVLAETEAPLATLHADLDRAAAYQREVFRRQVRAEEGQTIFVSDRSFDNLSYAASHTTALFDIADPTILNPYLDKVRTSLVFFCRPERELLAEDGVRVDVSWESAIRVDAMVQLMLEQWAIPYVPVRGTDRVERWRLVSAVVDLVRSQEELEKYANGQAEAVDAVESVLAEVRQEREALAELAQVAGARAVEAEMVVTFARRHLAKGQYASARKVLALVTK